MSRELRFSVPLGVLMWDMGSRIPLTVEHLSALKESKIEYVHGGEGLDTEVIDSVKSFLKDSPIEWGNALHVHVDPSTGEWIDLSSTNEAERVRSVRVVENAIDTLLRLGGDVLTFHASSGGSFSDDDRRTRFEQSKRSVGEIAEVCKRSNVRLAIEILHRAIPNGTTEALDLLEGSDPKIAGVCLDTNHMNVGTFEEDLAEAVHGIGERLSNCHVSDNDGLDERHWFPFDGVIEWQPFLEALVDISYEGMLEYEVNSPGHPWASIDPPMTVEQTLRRYERNIARLQNLLD